MFSALAQRAARVTLSNTQLPTDTEGRSLLTGEIGFLDNVPRDGYYYAYESNWGCCRQVNCCNSSLPWPEGKCWTCCPAQRHSPCTYNVNHTIIAYRTRDFQAWESLGALITPAMRNPGTVFVPRVIYNARDQRYVMWFENYNATNPDPAKPGLVSYSIAVSSSAAGPFTLVRDGPSNSAQFACGTVQGDFDLFTDDDGEAYIILTHYSSFCVERLTPGYLGGTGETASLPARDVQIAGHPPGDEAPA
jgi:hypothetical protein